MPELPDPKSQTTSSPNPSFNMNVKTVTSISSAWLVAHSWTVFDRWKWVKGNDSITFDGVKWVLNNSQSIQFVHELPE